MMQSGDRNQLKVVFPFEKGVETMWCDALGDMQFRLDNIPLFAYGISLGDVFSAKRRGDDSRLYFDHVLERSGNRTCRVTFLEGERDRNSAEMDKLLGGVESRSDGIERYGSDYVVYNIPARESFQPIEDLLDEGEQLGYWEWEMSSELPP